MANHSLSDVISTVTISKSEYENLVRDSEKLAVIERYTAKSYCVTRSDIVALLGEKEGDK